MLSSEDARVLADQLRNTIEKPFVVNDHELFLTASAGVTLYPDDGDQGEILLRNGNAAALRSKEAGGAVTSFFAPEFNERAKERLAIEVCLRRALSENDLTVLFQPIVSGDGDSIIAAEALARCSDGQGGIIPPDKFIPLAERTGLIQTLGDQVLEVACRQVREWRDHGAKSMRVAVNVSPRQFYSADLVQTITRCLEDYQLPSDALELEITEGLLLDDTPEVTTTLRDISNLGVPLSIDDFGTGYSSLSALRRFPIDVLKIDRSFVAKLTEKREDKILVDTIIKMAHGLGFRLVAEGVETKEQFAFLSEHECDYLQGYLFSKPLGSNELSDLLSKQKGVKPVFT